MTISTLCLPKLRLSSTWIYQILPITFHNRIVLILSKTKVENINTTLTAKLDQGNLNMNFFNVVAIKSASTKTISVYMLWPLCYIQKTYLNVFE